MIDFGERCTVWFSQLRGWNPSEVAKLKRLALVLYSSLVMCLLAQLIKIKSNTLVFKISGVSEYNLCYSFLIGPLKRTWHTKS